MIFVGEKQVYRIMSLFEGGDNIIRNDIKNKINLIHSIFIMEW